ncbi:MAG TPA: hypothetical protein VFL13_02385 [Candidatus Baltobacteraceae bacterium]|nr:hypothetical protein [Candidatus Baltobacteraceae bacterium]
MTAWRSLFLSGALALTAAAFAGARAQAAAEFCPATVASPVTPVDATHVRLRIGAAGARTVSGFLRMKTSGGWFSVPFFSVPLQEAPANYNVGGFSFSHSDYISTDLVVSFRQHVDVTYAYVSQAGSKGDADFGWDAKGSVSCLPTPVTKLHPAAPAPQPPPASNAIALIAMPMDDPFDAKCTVPDAPIAVTKAGEFRMPAALAHDNFTAMPEGTTGAIVAVDVDGSVVDAWLWETSGTPMLDKAVLDEARKTTFSPGRIFCRNVPGFYLLQTTFRP